MTRPFTAMAAAALALVLLSACETTKKEDRPADLPHITPVFTPKKIWTEGLGHGEPKLLLGIAPAIDGNRVYGSNTVGEVVALELANGHRVWKRKLKQPLSGGTGAGNGLVLVCAQNGTMYALAQQDGRELWHAQLSSEVLAAPVVAGNLVVVRTVDGKLYGLEAASGVQRWVADQQVPRLSLRGTSQPVIAGELALSGFDNGRLMAVTLGTGNTAWDVAVAQPRGSSELQRLIDDDSPAAVDGDDVFAVAFQGRAVRLARETGLEIWAHEISSYRGLAADGLGVYVSTADGNVVKLDRASGAERWRQQALARRSLTGPALQRNAIVVADYAGVIHWLDSENGKLMARAKTRARISSTPLVAGDLVLVQTETGRIEAWRAQWK
jgi:outer membrane protein assembly factor BamB